MSENFFVDHNSDLTAHPAVGGVVHPNSSPYKPAIHANPGHSSLPGEGREGVVGGSSHPAPGGGYMPYGANEVHRPDPDADVAAHDSGIAQSVHMRHNQDMTLIQGPGGYPTINPADAAANAGAGDRMASERAVASGNYAEPKTKYPQ